MLGLIYHLYSWPAASGADQRIPQHLHSIESNVIVVDIKVSCQVQLPVRLQMLEWTIVGIGAGRSKRG